MRRHLSMLACSTLVCAVIILHPVLSSKAFGDHHDSLQLYGNIFSMGQPSRTSLTIGALAGYRFDLDGGTQRYFLGMHSPVFLPHLGGINFTVENALQTRGGDYGLSSAFLIQAPIVTVGLEFDSFDENLFFKLSAVGTFWRYGFFRLGEVLRLDYTPGKQELQFGLVFRPPWQSYHRNRPRHTHVPLPQAGELPGANESDKSLLDHEALASVRHSMIWINDLLTPNLMHDVSNRKKERARLDKQLAVIRHHLAIPGHSFHGEDSTYHTALDRCFQTAAGDGSTGIRMARFARETMHAYIATPINRLFGQRKRPRKYDGFLLDASIRFADAIGREMPTLAEPNRRAAIEVFRRILATTKRILNTSQKRWKNERLIWLPLNYGLRLEDYDSQEEMNRVIEQLVDEPITDCNKVVYLQNDQWYYHLEKMILQANQYQVFLIHDISGKNQDHDDEITWRLIADGYLEAFIRAVDEMDWGKRDAPPVFMVYLDEHYYVLNKSRGVLSFMEDLFKTRSVSLDDPLLTARVNGQLERLHEAIEKSRVLSNLSEAVLKDIFKVHVNVTNRFDRSVASDAILRDHRKIAYRDIFENDPGRGIGILGGLGVGSHYVGRSWEDRSVLIRGPALTNLKAATRELILSQGHKRSEIPDPLLSVPVSDDFEDQCARLREKGWTTNALVVMNACGFGDKYATVLKAAVYNLTGKNMILVAPDSLWTCDFWVGMFVGAALRGCQVYAISPQPLNAPGTSSIVIELVGSALSTLVQSTKLLREPIADAGGALFVGLYDRDSDVHDMRARLERFFSLPNDRIFSGEGTSLLTPVVSTFDKILDSLDQNDIEPVHLLAYQEPTRPKLHLKVQFLINESALSTLNLPQGSTFLQAHFSRRRYEVSGSLGTEDVNYEVALAEFLQASKSIEVEHGESSNPVSMLLVGSHNQDRRSMLFDAETLALVAGHEALIALPDMVLILGTTRWVEDLSEIDELYPQRGGILRGLARWIKNLI